MELTGNRKEDILEFRVDGHRSAPLCGFRRQLLEVVRDQLNEIHRMLIGVLVGEERSEIEARPVVQMVLQMIVSRRRGRRIDADVHR